MTHGMGMLGAISDDGGSRGQRWWFDGGVAGKAEKTGESRSIAEARRRSQRPRRRVVAPYTRCHWMLLRPVVVGCCRARWGSVDPAWHCSHGTWPAVHGGAAAVGGCHTGLFAMGGLWRELLSAAAGDMGGVLRLQPAWGEGWLGPRLCTGKMGNGEQSGLVRGVNHLEGGE